MIIKKCKQCKEKFSTYPSRIKNGDGNFCSRKCCTDNKIGKKASKTTKQKMRLSQVGKHNGNKNAMWKGGQRCNGLYVYILSPDHPNATVTGYVLLSHLVIERSIGRYLKKGEVVHHINGIKDDNRIENLRLFKNQDMHIKFHNENRKIGRKYEKFTQTKK